MEYVSGDSTREIYEVVYTADITTLDGSLAYVDRLAYHVTGSTDVVLLSSSDPTPGDDDDWTAWAGGINFCDQNDPSGWVCTGWDNDGAGGSAMTEGGTYTWTTQISVAAGSIICMDAGGGDTADCDGAWSIQAAFEPSVGNGPLMSESAAVPLPGALLLFTTGLGLFGIGFKSRKKA